MKIRKFCTENMFSKGDIDIVRKAHRSLSARIYSFTFRKKLKEQKLTDHYCEQLELELETIKSHLAQLQMLYHR